MSYNGVVEGILVLLQPSSQVVGHSGGVVDDGEVRVGVRAGVRLGELGPLAQQVGHQLLSKGGVSGLGEERLLLKDGEEGHGLLKHVNALLQIHTEVDIRPVQSLADVHLLQHQGLFSKLHCANCENCIQRTIMVRSVILCGWID